MRSLSLVWLVAILAVVAFCPFFSLLNLDNVSLLSLAPTSGAGAANSSAAANATALAVFSAGAAGAGYYFLRRGRSITSFTSQQSFSVLNSIKSSISSAVEGIKNFLVKNSDAIKTGSDIAGWVSLGLFIAGAILSLTGIGAVVGVPLMTAAFAVGVGSAAADLAVGAARQSAGVADTDDYIRMGFAPLAFLPGGKAAGQAGKVAVKQIAKYAGKEVAEEAAKKLTRRELVTFASFLEGKALKPPVEARLIDKLQRLGIGSIDKGMERAFRTGNVHEMFKGSNFPKHPDLSFMNGRLNIEIKAPKGKRGFLSMWNDLISSRSQVQPGQAATVDSTGRVIPIQANSRNIVMLNYEKAKVLLDNRQLNSVAERFLKTNSHVSKLIISTKKDVIAVPRVIPKIINPKTSLSSRTSGGSLLTNTIKKSNKIIIIPRSNKTTNTGRRGGRKR